MSLKIILWKKILLLKNKKPKTFLENECLDSLHIEIFSKYQTFLCII